ncbi:inositol 2-dehydrogenase [Paenibacillus sp. GP183]|uniref:inositol 2-dehydrogenase n=1 Tax=Paenibacillus sp. GP183 TaxID=1882751 RepID=UPI000894210B|nr:inositol 2-dehydrogenase [Paenibacillus sp. GP183]SEB50246.1 myo-inositol 2-dehydrogenase / D-chiro-inositol 1-dehydrogenase [Paenibacillus sp. GP183]
MNSVKVGVIGAGRIGKIHAANLLRLPRVKMIGIADLYANEALQDWADERGIPHVTKDNMEIIHNPEIDAIFICSITDTHGPLIMEAARAGKHIFCEKPVSMDIAQTQKAVDTARECGVKLQIGFNRRFDHNFKRIQAGVQAGEIGTPHIVKITSRDPNPPDEGYIKGSGGIFMDMAIHDFDMARFVCGSDVEEVFAIGTVLVNPVFAQYEDVDTAIITLKFANGAIGVIDNSRQAVYGYDQRVEVFGSKGSLAANNDFPNTVEISTADKIYRDKPLNFFLERYNEAYIEETQLFIESIQRNTDVKVNGNDGLQAELIAKAAQLSCRLGKPVKLKDVIALSQVTL